MPPVRSSTARQTRMQLSPLIAIVGRPNVGKSTLFNKLVGSRRAIVGDEPGITRDRLYGDAHWLGHDFRVVDTGGILPEDKDPVEVILDKARRALNQEGYNLVYSNCEHFATECRMVNQIVVK